MATVLVIDDDQQIRRMVVRVLARDNHEVIEASDGQEGLKLFNARHPALVITDILMPEKEGIETIREIRAVAPHVPILAMSGGGTSKAMVFLDVAKALGADSALSKPFRADELIDAVNKLLQP
ncbi:MAG TPA: response regulator [Stellaceae bacterium]|nr:response regulator [Stellaceae bacterium]